jgi:hypothetical protein
VADVAGLPDDMSAQIANRGQSKDAVSYGTRLILAFERQKERPLYCRYLTGDIGDAATLANAVEEMKSKGISPSYILPDSVCYSDEALNLLIEGKTPFLTRIPYSEALCRNIILENGDIENVKYAVIYGRNCLFIKEIEMRIHGGAAFAYLVLNAERRGLEIAKAVSRAIGNPDTPEGLDLTDCGKTVLLSGKKLNVSAVMPLYHARKTAAIMFAVTKDDSGTVPLNAQKEPDFRGFMLFAFIAAVMLSELRGRVAKSISVPKALAALRSFRCDVLDNRVVLSGISESQKYILRNSNVRIPRNN